MILDGVSTPIRMINLCCRDVQARTEVPFCKLLHSGEWEDRSRVARKVETRGRFGEGRLHGDISYRLPLPTAARTYAFIRRYHRAFQFNAGRTTLKPRLQVYNIH